MQVSCITCQGLVTVTLDSDVATSSVNDWDYMLASANGSETSIDLDERDKSSKSEACDHFHHEKRHGAYLIRNEDTKFSSELWF